MPGGVDVASIRIPRVLWSSSTPALWSTPCQATTGSEKRAEAPIAGWIERPRPSTRVAHPGCCGARASASRARRPRRSRAAPEAPAARPSGRLARTPEARPSSVSTRSTLRRVAIGCAKLARGGQRVQVNSRLCVVRAADRALAGAAATRSVAAEWPVRPAERRRAGQRQLAVSAHHFHRNRRDSDHLFDV